MRSLTRLEMARLPKITDEGLLSLGGLEELRSLDLSHTDQLTRTGVVALQSLTKLTQLKCVLLLGNISLVCDMEILFLVFIFADSVSVHLRSSKILGFDRILLTYTAKVSIARVYLCKPIIPFLHRALPCPLHSAFDNSGCTVHTIIARFDAKLCGAA